MASSIVLRRACAAPSFFSKLLNPIRSVSVASSSTRSFSSNVQKVRDFEDGDVDDRRYDVDRRSDRSLSGRRDAAPFFFPDVFDPFSPTRSVSQLLNMMDQFMENPFVAASRGMGAGSRRNWDVKEDNDALYLRMDMPGLGKEDVKVAVEQNTLIIKGEAEKETEEEEESSRRYSSRIDLPPNLYRADQIRAEMKNGVLRVAVPKVKEEERKDVFQVKID